MEKLTLTIVEERNTFREALYYLNYLKLEDVVHNEELKDYINQMLYNEKEELQIPDLYYCIVLHVGVYA